MAGSSPQDGSTQTHARPHPAARPRTERASSSAIDDPHAGGTPPSSGGSERDSQRKDAPQASAEPREGLSAWEALGRHRRSAAATTLVGALLGALVALMQPTTYTGEYRLAVGQGEMSALNIPGYPTATKDLASNYSRWVTDHGVAGMRLPEGVTSLTASPLPDSSVVRIEATAEDPDTATAGAKSAADALSAEVNRARSENDPAVLLAEIESHAPEVSRAQAGAAGTLARYNRDVVNNAPAEVIAADLEAHVQTDSLKARLEVQQDARKERYRRLVSTRTTEAQLFPVWDAPYLSGSDNVQRIQRAGLIGGGLGLVLAATGAAAWERRRRGNRA